MKSNDLFDLFMVCLIVSEYQNLQLFGCEAHNLDLTNPTGMGAIYGALEHPIVHKWAILLHGSGLAAGK